MNNLMSIIQFFSCRKNPQQFFNQYLEKNPQAMQILQQIQNSTEGASPKQVAMQLAKQRGISETDLMGMYNMFGNK